MDLTNSRGKSNKGRKREKSKESLFDSRFVTLIKKKRNALPQKNKKKIIPCIQKKRKNTMNDNISEYIDYLTLLHL